jgi:hypothetical protein
MPSRQRPAEAGLIGEQPGLRPVGTLQLVEDARDVLLHGRLAQVQAPGDGRVGQPLTEPGQDLGLPFGQPADQREPAVLLGLPLGHRHHQPVRRRWGEHGVPVHGDANELDEVLRWRRLEQETRRPGTQRSDDVVVGVERGERHDHGGSAERVDPLDRGQPVAARNWVAASSA